MWIHNSGGEAAESSEEIGKVALVVGYVEYSQRRWRAGRGDPPESPLPWKGGGAVKGTGL